MTSLLEGATVDKQSFEIESAEEDRISQTSLEDDSLSDMAPSRINLHLEHNSKEELLEERMGRLWKEGVLDRYVDILQDSKASIWLFTTLEKSLALCGIVPSDKNAIRESVFMTLGAKRRDTLRQVVSRSRDPPTSVAHFEVQWDPVEFLAEVSLGEPEEAEDPISRLITVTGDGDVLQALPCQDYMSQTWPLFESKVPLLSLLSLLVADPKSSHRGITSFSILNRMFD